MKEIMKEKSSVKLADGVELKEIEVEETFIDSIDFNELFRVNGKKGLFTPRSGVNKGGMLSVMAFLNKQETAIVHKSKMECLGQLSFMTTEMETVDVPLPEFKTLTDEKVEKVDEMKKIQRLKILDMRQVFNNLYKYAIDSEDWAFQEKTLDELMEIMVPKFDKMQFRTYHAEKVLLWYMEVTTKVSAAIDEGKAKQKELETKEEETK
jgi:hypothetical protein